MLQVRKGDGVWEQGISALCTCHQDTFTAALGRSELLWDRNSEPSQQACPLQLPSQAGSCLCPAKAQNLAHAKGAQWVFDEQTVLGKKLDLPKRPCAHRNTLLLPMASSLKQDLPFPLELKVPTCGQATLLVEVPVKCVWTSSYRRVLVRTDWSVCRDTWQVLSAQ